MKIFKSLSRSQAGSAMLGYLFIALVAMATLAAIAQLVVQNLQYGKRREDIVNALQFAQGGAALCASDVQAAFTNGSGIFLTNLTSATYPYTKNSSLSTSTTWVYQRTITNVFTNQSVIAQVWMTNSAVPDKVQIIASATVNGVTQTSQMNIEMTFSAGAAIVSTAKGDASTGASKSTAQGGDVVILGGSSSPDIVDGGIMANGAINTNTCSVDSIAEGLYGTAGQIPDYTSPGSTNQLFDFNRFIAVADVSNNHYTNPTPFITAMNALKGAAMEGVVVVDIPYSASGAAKFDSSTMPYGFNVHGTLVINFKNDAKGTWLSSDKVVNSAAMNINAANLSGLNVNDDSTFTTGYPFTNYVDSTKNPVNVDITGKGFQNFRAGDDLPAYMFNNAIMDMHGPVNICGVVYSPCFMEIENKQSGQIQYFKGSLIGGGGIYVENNSSGAKSIVSYDPNALDKLATSGVKGKTVKIVYYK